MTEGTSPAGHTEAEDVFVLDGSVTLAWGFEDETNAYADAILDRLPEVQAIVPSIWPLEVANALLVGERRGRTTQAANTRFVDLLASVPIDVDEDTSERAFSDIMTLARAQDLSTYDAAYLELALRRGLPLATSDRRLETAATAVGVTLYLRP